MKTTDMVQFTRHAGRDRMALQSTWQRVGLSKNAMI